MWPFNLSVRLLIVDLVSRYLTNYLIRREPILMRISPLIYFRCLLYTLCGISSRFQLLSPSLRQVAHALLTRPPLSSDSFDRSLHHLIPVRLECVMHAASVYPEPGSNSLKKLFHLYLVQTFISLELNLFALLTSFLGYHYPFSDSVYSLLGIVRVNSLYLCLLKHNLVFRCSIFKVQVAPRFRGQLCYYITVFPFCQYLF